MRLSVLQENFSKGLSIVGRAVSSRSTLPVLGNILLSTDDNRLKLAATNLEVGVSCWLGAQVEDDGAITLPARLLTDWVNSMQPDRIDMEMVVRQMSMHLKCGRSESNIKGIDASEFPLIPTADGTNALGSPAATLRKIIDQVAFAAADAKTPRPALTGVLAKFEGDRLTLAATDGYRLSVRRTLLPAAAPADISIIIPARSLGEVSRISGEADPDRPVEITVAPRATKSSSACSAGARGTRARSTRWIPGVAVDRRQVPGLPRHHAQGPQHAHRVGHRCVPARFEGRVPLRPRHLGPGGVHDHPRLGHDTRADHPQGHFGRGRR